MQKIKLSILFASLLSSLISCTTHAPNVPVCVELSLDRGWCTNTVTAEEFYVDEQHPYKGKTWWDMRPNTVRLPSESWKELKVFIISVCKEHNICSEITSWDRTVNAIDNKLNNGEVLP